MLIFKSLFDPVFTFSTLQTMLGCYARENLSFMRRPGLYIRKSEYQCIFKADYYEKYVGTAFPPHYTPGGLFVCIVSHLQ